MRDIPDIHFDARYNWFRWSDKGHPIPLRNEPFTDANEAIRYALKQLQSTHIAASTLIVNARAALLWATAKARAASDAGR